MRKSSRLLRAKNVLIISFIMLIVFVALSFAFISINFSTINTQARKDVEFLNKNITSNIEGITSSYYDEMNLKISTIDSTKDDYKDDIKSLYEEYSNNNFISFGFYSSTSDLTLYNGSEYISTSFVDENNARYTEKVSFIKQSNVIKNIEDSRIATLYSYKINETTYIIALQDFKVLQEAFNTSYENVEKKSFYIMTLDGSFYVSNANNNLSHLHRFLSYEDSVKYLDELKDKGYSSELYKVNDKRYYFISSTMLNDYNEFGLVFLSVVSADYVNSFYNAIKVLCFIFVILSGVIVILGLCLLGNDINNRYMVYGQEKFSFKYSKAYSLVAKHNGTIIIKNNAFKKKFDNHNIYKNIFDFKISNDEDLREILSDGRSFTAEIPSLDGEFINVRFYVIRVKSNYHLIGDVEHSITIDNDKVASLAYVEPLTKLYNVNYLRKRIDEVIANSKNVKKTIIQFDLIEFKNINTLFGREFGDDVIIYLSNKLKEFLTKGDELFAIGADKFAILTNSSKEYNFIYDKCKKMYDELIKPQTINSNNLNLAVSFGIFDINPEDFASLTSDDVLKKVELANGRAHSVEGRKIYVYDKGLSQLIERDAIILHDLEKAVKTGEFVTFYQPQYDLSTNKVTGFEALLRWNNHKYLHESPLEYIKLAERTNLIIPIGNKVMNDSFIAAKKLYQNGYKDFHISVNFSIAQLIQSGFVSEFIKKYDEYEIPYDLISVEITETMLITSMDEIKEKLEIIRNKGIKVYIDDFGMGYSSLLYLNDLPVDYIKLDREFIKYLQHNKNSRIIVGSVLDMANELEIGIVAEGVEDQYQVDYLYKHGCKLIQGWIVSKAKDETKLEEMLNENKIINIKLANQQNEDNNQKITYGSIKKKSK